MDFEIVDGVLKKYRGNDAEVVIPDSVTSIKRARKPPFIRGAGTF